MVTTAKVQIYTVIRARLHVYLIIIVHVFHVIKNATIFRVHVIKNATIIRALDLIY